MFIYSPHHSYIAIKLEDLIEHGDKYNRLQGFIIQIFSRGFTAAYMPIIPLEILLCLKV